MKVTKEEIKGLNVEAYMSWLIDTANSMEFAYKEIPIIKKEISRLVLDMYKWFRYYEHLKPNNANQERYKVYLKLADKKLEELQKTVISLENNFDHVPALASAENSLKVIKEHTNGNDSTVIKNKEGVKKKPKEAFTKKDLEELEALNKRYLKEGFTFTKSLSCKYAETIDFVELSANIHVCETMFTSHLKWDLNKFKKMQQVNSNAISTVLKELENKEFKYIDCILTASFCREFFYNMEVVTEFAKIAYYSHVANEDINSIELTTQNNGNKLTCAEKLRLLEAIGVFELPTFSIHPIEAKYTKESQYRILADILEESQRHVKGNLLAIRDNKPKPPYNPNNQQVTNKINTYLDNLK